MKFKELRNIDVTEHLEEKGKFKYLSWAWAVDTLLQHDETATWHFKEPTTYPDGTMMVHCTVFAFGKEMPMHLPVLDYNNKPIKNPNAFNINTSMMRCLVKCIALYGIGLHVYAGEDLPPDEQKKQELTLEHRKIQRDYSYYIGSSMEADEVNQYLEEVKTLDLPEIVLEGLTDQADTRIKQIENGVHPKATWGFINVQEAVEFAQEKGNYINEATDAKILGEHMVEIDHKLKALDQMLNANKYIVDGVAPYQRIINKYTEKSQQLTGGKNDIPA